jgi:hypothetical protein
VLVNKGVGAVAGAVLELPWADCANSDVTHNKIAANTN